MGWKTPTIGGAAVATALPDLGFASSQQHYRNIFDVDVLVSVKGYCACYRGSGPTSGIWYIDPDRHCR